MKSYIFRYNGNMQDVHEDVEPGELTYHEHLMEQDGRRCTADLSTVDDGVVEAYFEDGNELSVYPEELTEVDE